MFGGNLGPEPDETRRSFGFPGVVWCRRRIIISCVITSDRDERRARLGGRALAADTNARLSHSEGACERGGVGRRGAAVRLAVPVLLLGASLAAAIFASRAFTVMPKVQTKLLNKQVLLILQAHSFTLTHSNK